MKMAARTFETLLEKAQTLAWACPHTNKPNHGHGLCGTCYMRKRRSRMETTRDMNGDPLFRHPEIALAFVVQKNCRLCGDAFEGGRVCQLHPEICDACEREYCECKVEDKVELMPLNEIIAMREDARIPFLHARKMTLRLAGKATNSMPDIVIRNESETVYTAFRRRAAWQEDDPWRENAKRALEEMGDEESR